MDQVREQKQEITDSGKFNYNVYLKLFGITNVLFMTSEGVEKNLLTSLGSGSDSEEDEEKPMFGEGDDDDYYEQLVGILIGINKIFCVCCFIFVFIGN